MAERAVTWVDGVQVSGRDMRLAQTGLLVPASALAARSGVLSGLAVTARATPDMSVDVAAGQCAVTVTETSPGGAALCANDATVTRQIEAASATNPRIDLIVARVFAEVTAQAERRWALEVVTGTPAASPVAPSLPPNSLLLRSVTVPANASAITEADLSPTLPARTTALGGIVPSLTADDVVGQYVGQYRDRTDTGATERWTGTEWRRVAGPAQRVLNAGQGSSFDFTTYGTHTVYSFTMPVAGKVRFHATVRMLVSANSGGTADLRVGGTATGTVIGTDRNQTAAPETKLIVMGEADFAAGAQSVTLACGSDNANVVNFTPMNVGGWLV